MDKTYGYISPHEKPCDSKVIHEKVKAELKIEPLTTRVNNTSHEVEITFAEELDKNAKKKLDKLMEEIFKESGESGTSRVSRPSVPT